MKRIFSKLLLFFAFVMLFVYCNNKVNNNTKAEKQIAGYLGTDTIYVNEIDPLIKQQLHDYLYRIYYSRKVALEETAKEKVLQLEANSQGLSKEELIKQQVDEKVNEKGIKAFIKKYNLENGLQLVENKRLVVYTYNTIEGKKAYTEAFKDYLKKSFFDSLMNKYNFRMALKAPQVPPAKFEDDIYVHYRGNLNATVTVFELSDLDCEHCKEANPLFNIIYEKYKNKIRWGFVHFSTQITLAAKAAEAAHQQGRFWQMHDLLMKSEHIYDTTVCYNYAKQLGLNLDKFKLALNDTSINQPINKTFAKLKKANFYGTPTLVVNGKIISDSFSTEEIEKTINEALQ